MSHRRQIFWSAALRDMRGDRINNSPEASRLRLRQEGFAKIGAERARMNRYFRPFTSDGKLDRRTIMRAAVGAAQARRVATGEEWKVCMAAALTGTWSATKLLHRLAKHRALLPVVMPVK